MTTDEGYAKRITQILGETNVEPLRERQMCDACLGRLFAKVDAGIPNTERGAAAREALGIEPVTPEKCWLCDGLTGEYDRLSDLVIKKLAEWEYETFLIGSKFDAETLEKEEMLWAETTGGYSESIKAEFNREVGKRVEAKTSKEACFGIPDIVAIVDPRYDSVQMQVSPLYIYGRYRKLVRGIPQTKWPCRACLGKGCERCGGTGAMYNTSVEEIIARKVMSHSGGTGHKFHGMGREDVDALMLGRGRPFILEISNPKKRAVSLPEVEKAVNGSEEGVGVSSLRPSTGAEVVDIKHAKPDKRYRIRVAFKTEVQEGKLKEVVASLGGKKISQETPNRVLHRRADKIRVREIKKLGLSDFAPTEATLELTTEAGTYVKEFAHGDGGRTTPSLANELGVECEVKELDVLEILDETL
ncbi:MAG: tRNA pseudouridine(54/55) synthase Pus10 [Candidatus Dadabacteria bacterium]|nr:tRNA pseudouridine(54/55) synthase Pus10 [Candidatus Dadabacteria bacterium]